jgi:hypothetical protein
MKSIAATRNRIGPIHRGETRPPLAGGTDQFGGASRFSAGL